MHCGCNINLPDEIDINSPIVIEPDEINSADATLTGLRVWSSLNDHFSKGRDTQIVEPRIFGFRWRLMARWKALLLLYNVVKRALYVTLILTVFRPLKVRH